MNSRFNLIKLSLTANVCFSNVPLPPVFIHVLYSSRFLNFIRNVCPVGDVDTAGAVAFLTTGLGAVGRTAGLFLVLTTVIVLPSTPKSRERNIGLPPTPC